MTTIGTFESSENQYLGFGYLCVRSRAKYCSNCYLCSFSCLNVHLMTGESCTENSNKGFEPVSCNALQLQKALYGALKKIFSPTDN